MKAINPERLESLLTAAIAYSLIERHRDEADERADAVLTDSIDRLLSAARELTAEETGEQV